MQYWNSCPAAKITSRSRFLHRLKNAGTAQKGIWVTWEKEKSVNRNSVIICGLSEFPAANKNILEISPASQAPLFCPKTSLYFTTGARLNKFLLLELSITALSFSALTFMSRKINLSPVVFSCCRKKNRRRWYCDKFAAFFEIWNFHVKF